VTSSKELERSGRGNYHIYNNHLADSICRYCIRIKSQCELPSDPELYGYNWAVADPVTRVICSAAVLATVWPTIGTVRSTATSQNTPARATC